MLSFITPPRNIYQDVPVVLEVGLWKGLGQDISVLISRFDVLDANLTHPEQIADEVETHFGVLALAELRGFSIKVLAPWLFSRTLILAPRVSDAMEDNIAFAKKAFLTPSPAAIYSASDVDSDTTCCVLLAWLTTVPPRGTATPATDLLSFAFST